MISRNFIFFSQTLDMNFGPWHCDFASAQLANHKARNKMPIKLHEAIKRTNCKILCYGGSGTGKTTLIGTLPAGRVLVLAAEDGLLALQDLERDDIEVESIADWKQLSSVVTAIRSGSFRWSDGQPFVDKSGQIPWLVVDSVTEVSERLNQQLKADDAVNGFGAYNGTHDRTLQMLQVVRDLPCDVLFICKEKVDEEKIKVNKEVIKTNSFSPLFPYAALSAAVPYLFDFVLRLTVEDEVIAGKKVATRLLQTGRTSAAVAKSRSSALSLYEPADLAALVAKVYQ